MTELKAVPRMRTIKQVSEEFDLPLHFVRSLVWENRIKYVKAGKKYLINLDSLAEYLQCGEGA